MTKLKLCPICGIGKPRIVHYAPPLVFLPDQWEETEDCLYEPKLTFKRIECSNCGASTGALEISSDAAIRDWNQETSDGIRCRIVQYYIDEDMEVEE
jgi:hypothetical protein